MRGIFTPAVQESLSRARREADRLNSTVVGSAHWLLGLRRLPDCAAQRVLRSMGVVLESGAATFEQRAAEAEEIDHRGAVPYTPALQRAIARALEVETEERRAPQIGTHHFLVAMLETDLTTAIDLATLGVTAKALRAKIEASDPALLSE